MGTPTHYFENCWIKGENQAFPIWTIPQGTQIVEKETSLEKLEYLEFVTPTEIRNLGNGQQVAVSNRENQTYVPPDWSMGHHLWNILEQ